MSLKVNLIKIFKDEGNPFLSFEKLTDKILALEPFQKLERVENYLEIKTNEVRNEEDVTDDYINGFNNGIKNVVKGIASILSKNEKVKDDKPTESF